MSIEKEFNMWHQFLLLRFFAHTEEGQETVEGVSEIWIDLLWINKQQQMLVIKCMGQS